MYKTVYKKARSAYSGPAICSVHTQTDGLLSAQLFSALLLIALLSNVLALN